MPYSWETRHWISEIQRSKIKTPPFSGLYMSMSPFHSARIAGLTDCVAFRNVEKLAEVAYRKASQLESNRKLMKMDKLLKDIEHMIRRKKSGYSDGKDWGGVTMSDLQGFWYAVRVFIYDRTLVSVPENSINVFMDEYWSLVTKLLKPLLDGGKSILEGLLCCKGVGPVNPMRFLPGTERHTEPDGIDDDLSEFFRQVSDLMPQYKISISKVGSEGEGCRVGYRDEFDYRVEFNVIDIVTLLQGDFSKHNIQKVCSQYEPSLYDIHPAFMETVKSLCNKDARNRLRLLAAGVKTVPWLLFRFCKDPAHPQQWSLVKVDCALTIPCPGVWPGEHAVDPLGKPIKGIAHLMVPSSKSKDNPWRWSVCSAQQDFFRTLPKYVKLGYIISKIIVSCALFSEDLNPPKTYILKTSLFNAVANKDIVIVNDTTDSEELILKAIPVADAILAGLDRTQFGYFHPKDQVEFLWDYVTMWNRNCNTFLPQHLLHRLVKDHLANLNKSSKTAPCIEDLLPMTRRLMQGKTLSTGLGFVRDVMGLLRLPAGEKDSWRRIAEESGMKRGLILPNGVEIMWRDTALPDMGLHDRCAAKGLEMYRAHFAKLEISRLTREYYGYNEVNHIASSMICQSMKLRVEARSKPYKSLGEAYNDCEEAFSQMIKDLTEAVEADVNDKEEGEKKLEEARNQYNYTPGYYLTESDHLRFVLSKGHLVDLTQTDSLMLWKDTQVIQFLGFDDYLRWQVKNEKKHTENTT